MDAYSVCARWIFPSFDPRCPCRRNPHPDGSTHDCGFDLSKTEASRRWFEAKPKLEDTDPFAELAVARGVLPRGQTSIVERPPPVLDIAAWRDDQPCPGCIVRAWQAQHRSKDTGEITAAMRDSEPATAVHHRFRSMGEADGLGELLP